MISVFFFYIFDFAFLLGLGVYLFFFLWWRGLPRMSYDRSVVEIGEDVGQYVFDGDDVWKEGVHEFPFR